MSKFKPKDTALANVCATGKVRALKSRTTHSQTVVVLRLQEGNLLFLYKSVDKVALGLFKPLTIIKK
jgi:hypothetical protein